jgi:hypothetical protein
VEVPPLVRALRVGVIAIWMLAAAYLGAGGWIAGKTFESSTAPGRPGEYVEFDGISFDSTSSMLAYIRDTQRSQLFPWIFAVPQEIMPLITALAFGLLGGTANIVKKVARDRISIEAAPIVATPVFGALIGLMLFLISLVVPAVFISGPAMTRTETLAGISFFGGAFAEIAFPWLEKQIRGLFVGRPTPVKNR